MNQYHFDREKPFYPLVISFFTVLHGFKEFCALGGVKKLGLEVGGLLPGKNWPDMKNMPPESQSVFNEAIKIFERLRGPIDLKITGDVQRLNVPLETISVEMVDNWNYLIDYQIRAASMVLAMGYHEIQYSKTLGTKKEFLFHCRNAVAHNGRFDFRNGVKREAEWREIEIDEAMKGRPLFVTPKTPDGLLNIGDPIALLWDIEQEMSRESDLAPGTSSAKLSA